MQPTSGPVIPRRRLGAELRRLRKEANLHLDQVASELMISTSKLSRLENAQGRPHARDVRDLIKLYGIEGTPLADRLNRWVRAARERAWWMDYADEISGGLDEHLAYESQASTARVYTLPVLPVLLQTADYARAYYQATEPWLPADHVEKLVQIRLRRQTALHARDSLPPLRLIAVSHESCLRQSVGSRATMRSQLNKLIEQSDQFNVDFFVLPFSASPVFGFTCMYALFEFSDPDIEGILRIETAAGFRQFESKDVLTRWRKYHDELVRKSLDPKESQALIHAALAEI